MEDTGRYSPLLDLEPIYEFFYVASVGEKLPGSPPAKASWNMMGKEIVGSSHASMPVYVFHLLVCCIISEEQEEAYIYI